MEDLLEIIDEVVKYGLNSNLNIQDKEIDLEAHLIRFYSKYFEIEYTFDERTFPEFSKIETPNVIENVRSNFPDFGLYHEVLDVHELDKEAQKAMGYAVDDLSDIIYDLLEIKWRWETNSKSDGLWFFELIFKAHTQQHIISLINYMKSKNG